MGFAMNKQAIVVKRIWPFPALVFCWQKYEIEYDEPLKIYKFGWFDYRFDFKGTALNIWIEKE